jgi:hypothetical protein
MWTKIIVGIMVLALVAIWFSGSANEIASMFIVLAIAAFAYATARSRSDRAKNPEK